MNNYGKIVFFDFDGTLTKKDVFLMFFLKYFVSIKIIIELILDFKIILVPFKKKAILENIKIRWIFHALKNKNIEDVNIIAKNFIDHKWQKIKNTNIFNALIKHQSNNDKIVIVTANLDILLAPWCKEKNIDLICTELEIKKDQYTGLILNDHCFGKVKSQRIMNQYKLQNYSAVVVYGNWPDDKEMLQLATSDEFKIIV